MKTLTIAGLLLLAAPLCGQQQPIPYSHKTHLALGLECSSCHTNADPGEFMGLPAESFCMSCHQAVKTDSPYIQKLAEAARAGEPIPGYASTRFRPSSTSATASTPPPASRAKAATAPSANAT
ncbi:MAG: cytochrome c3 family protein [Bryobacterales bacterium]